MTNLSQHVTRQKYFFRGLRKINFGRALLAFSWLFCISLTTPVPAHERNSFGFIPVAEHRPANQSPLGTIYLLGTYHKDLAPETMCARDEQDAIACQDRVVQWINAYARPRDVVLYEGAIRNAKDFTPRREIIDFRSQPAKTTYQFEKDLFLIGWEDEPTLKLAKFAHDLRKRAHQTDNPLAHLRADYFYLHIVLYQRNKSLLQFLSEATSRTPSDLNIFVLVGGGHLSDPKLLSQVQAMGRPYVAQNDPRADRDIHADFQLLRTNLLRLGQSPKKIEDLYEQLFNELTVRRELTRHQLRYAENYVLNLDDPTCDSFLLRTPQD